MIIDAWSQLMPVGDTGIVRYRPDLKGKEITAEVILEAMDRHGVDKMMIAGLGEDYKADNEKVARALEKYPDRFIGVYHLDKQQSIVKNIEQLAYYVKNYQFKAIRIEPFMLRKNPDDAYFYPYYAKACELDIAVQLQVGNTANRIFPMETGRPIYVDRAAMDFPELRLICGHIGWPWTAEMIAVAWRHPNVYIDTSAHTPKHFPAEFIQFLRTFGQDKCIFASDWPLLSFDRLFKEAEQYLNLSAEVANKFYAENAIRALKLEL